MAFLFFFFPREIQKWKSRLFTLSFVALMVNRRISNDLKECALRLWESGWSQDDICSTLQVSKRSMYRWREIFDEFGSVCKPPSPIRGRQRRISRAVLDSIHLIYRNDPDTYLDEVQWWLAYHHNIAISIPALHRNLAESGLTRKLLHKIASERDEQLRADYRENMRELLDGSGMQPVFVDETSKNDHDTARRHGLAVVGERAEFRDVFVRGDRYSLVAALARDGYIAAKAVPGSFDSLDFYDFIAEEVVCIMSIEWHIVLTHHKASSDECLS
jgi:transposase